jgi:hypothetical protein
MCLSSFFPRHFQRFAVRHSHILRHSRTPERNRNPMFLLAGVGVDKPPTPRALAAHLYHAFGIASRWNCYHQVLGPVSQFPKFADARCRYSDASVRLDAHLIWQTTKGDVERNNAFGSVSHEGSRGADARLRAVTGLGLAFRAASLASWHASGSLSATPEGFGSICVTERGRGGHAEQGNPNF